MIDRTPVLTLVTAIARPTVMIDGQAYSLRTAEDFSRIELTRLINLGKRMDAIEQLKEPSDGDEREYQALLGQLASRVTMAPAPVLETLTVAQKTAIAITFARLQTLGIAPAPVAEPPAPVAAV